MAVCCYWRKFHVANISCFINTIRCLHVTGRAKEKTRYTAAVSGASFQGDTPPPTFWRVGDTISNVPPHDFELVCIITYIMILCKKVCTKSHEISVQIACFPFWGGTSPSDTPWHEQYNTNLWSYIVCVVTCYKIPQICR